MGSATAYALASRGLRVVLFEQFSIGHTRGSSHGTSRIFRLSYPDVSYVALAQESLALWRQLEARTGEQVLVTTGGLDTGKPLDEHVEALDACGAPFEVIDGRVANGRYALSLPPDEAVLFQPDAGIALADKAWRLFSETAVADGATLLERTPVGAMEVRDDRVGIDIEGGAISARAVVVTAGAWARRLLADIGIHLPTVPTRETVAYFSVPARPVPSVVDWGEPAVYVLAAPGVGIKVGEHHVGPATDPNDTGEINHESVARISTWLAARFPAADATPAHAETCLYTNTPEERFIVERHDRIVVGSPCSGHGFKFAPLIGERLAALALEAVDA